MYKVIVVGTDGSDRARVAANEAIALAQANSATLHVVHAVHTTTTMLGDEYVDLAAVAETQTEMRDEGQQICSQVVADAKQAGVVTHMHNVEGNPAHVLIGVAEDVGADLVVLGNRGMTGIKRLVLGSVSNKVSHHCPCSLLIVNTDTE